jgi:heat shock protein HslJ
MKEYKMKIQKHLQIVVLLLILLSSCSGNEPKVEAPLRGKTWVLSTYSNTHPITGHQPTLKFDADQISGTTGCNHYGGTYHIEGDSIRFAGIYSTEMACPDPEGLMDQERIYLGLLRAADQFELADGVLTLFTETNPILVFEIQADEPVSTG